MTSRAGQLISAPTWGAGRARREASARRPAVRFRRPPSAAADAAGAALVLGGSVALWAAFLAAVW